MAKSGLAIWRENNCQACHQIYGYGGFLGPDLTNLMDRRPDEDWKYI
ncbi:MAG: c-type cytochrome, partial [Planctomycetes bacterium]|nr:c-type cytochrome [Planctomycetota bacterium]